VNSKTELVDGLPAEGSLVGLVGFRETTHGTETLIQVKNVSTSSAPLTTMELASLPLERMNHNTVTNRRAETPDSIPPGTDSDQECGLPSFEDTIQTESERAFVSQSEVETGPCIDSPPSQDSKSPKNTEGGMAHGAMNMSNAQYQEDGCAEPVAQGDSESSNEHLDQCSEADGESIALINSNKHDLRTTITLGQASRHSSLQRVAADALDHHHEHFIFEHQHPHRITPILPSQNIQNLFISPHRPTKLSHAMLHQICHRRQKPLRTQRNPALYTTKRDP
jgi:hypothetical protein